MLTMVERFKKRKFQPRHFRNANAYPTVQRLKSIGHLTRSHSMLDNRIRFCRDDSKKKPFETRSPNLRPISVRCTEGSQGAIDVDQAVKQFGKLRFVVTSPFWRDFPPVPITNA